MPLGLSLSAGTVSNTVLDTMAKGISHLALLEPTAQPFPQK